VTTRNRSRRGTAKELHPQLAALIRTIGTPPEPSAFEPSPFQREALDLVRRQDVLVEAPTGSGKTWIAEEAIREGLAVGLTAWYTTPLKALSNQKFRRFQKLYGEERVGLLTGERRINGGAPVIVATTEILRNSLYEGDRAPHLAILDEAHYLSDPERGTAWEEVLMYAPAHARMLLLSATLPNCEELAAWLAEVRGARPAVVVETVRPVPLHYVVADRWGRLRPFPAEIAVEAGGRRPDWLPSLLHHLEGAGLLPAIFFFPARRLCDDAANALARDAADDADARRVAWRTWESEFPHLREHGHRQNFLRAGIAPHHAGHLTSWRMAVESFLERGLLRAVCATTTLAAGLDVPARTVALTTLVRNSPNGPVWLSATEFHQMAGRAGRRGKDTAGFVILPATDDDEAAQGEALAGSEPDPVRSAFAPSYAQVLNLLRTRPLAVALDELRRSLAAFQRRKEVALLESEIGEIAPDPLADRPCGARVFTRARYERLVETDQPVGDWPCTTCPVATRCVATIDDLRRRELRRSELRRALRGVQQGLQEAFMAHAGILRTFGYLDRDFAVTPDGRWAASLRNAKSLILSELIRRALMPIDPNAIARFAASLSTERAPRVGAEVGLTAVAEVVRDIQAHEGREGIDSDATAAEFAPDWDRVMRRRVPSPADRRAHATELWMRGWEFGRLTTEVDVAEGDMQRILLQTAELLHQLEALPQDAVRAAASAARTRIMRPPLL